MVQIFSKIIQQRREESEEITSQRTDILQIFIDMKYKDDGIQLSNDEVVGLLIALLFAGNAPSYIHVTWGALSMLDVKIAIFSSIPF